MLHVHQSLVHSNGFFFAVSLTSFKLIESIPDIFSIIKFRHINFLILNFIDVIY